MAKKCPVRSLSDNSLAELANLVVSSVGYSIQNNSNGGGVIYEDLDHDVTITMVYINSYFETAGATSDIYQDLLRVILSSDRLDPSLRFACLQMLLNSSVQCLVTDIFPYSYYESILQVIAAQGSRLRTLNLKGVWVKDEHIHYLFDIIKKCKLLTKLHIPYIANDEILEVIASSLPNLRLLDVCGETDITENGIEFLCNGLSASNLTVVDIGVRGEENICRTDIAMLLENCPNIETLGTYSFVGEALEHIHDNSNRQFKTKLKYLHDTKTDNNVLSVIVKMCPNLESLYLDSPKHGILYRLETLKLRKFKINRFICGELMELLAKIGSTLAHLTIIKGTGGLELGKLARYCSTLMDLDCYMMDIITYVCEIKFDRLQGLEILHSSMTPTAMKHFIANTTSLKRLAIDTVPFTDDELTGILIENDFCELEDVWFTSAPNLSVVAIEMLMERCPELQSIGQLSGWNLTTDDLELVRGILKSSNLSLILSPNNLFP